MNSGERERERARAQEGDRDPVGAVRTSKLQLAPFASTSAVDRDSRLRTRLRADRDQRGASRDCDRCFARSRRRSRSRLRADRDPHFAPSIAVEASRSQASIWVLCLFFWFCLFPCSIFQTLENIFRKIF